ncbi:AraC family transcriptional regulator [Pedobacter jamesrossensis]|uniref:AraC family transcriptional regulator n=1 Tax=Pedobacter jamesrossensis TaxID=1908238 RepID=A0ABV8NL33_9SPHI
MDRNFPFFDTCSLSPCSKADIYVSTFSSYIRSNRKLLCPHRHSFYHLVLFTRGSGLMSIDFNSFEISPQQIYFMIPGQLQTFACDENAEGYIINFSVPFFNSFLLKADYLDQFSYLKGSINNSIIQIPEASTVDILSLFDSILSESSADKRMGTDMLKVLMLQLFIHLSRLSNQKRTDECTTHKSGQIKKFLNLIEENLFSMKLPSEYAQRLFMTTNHLNSLCNEMLGKSSREIISERIIMEAKRLMVNHELSISEIGYKLNFNDNSYFSKFFKKHTEMTPEEFRRNLGYGTGQRHARVFQYVD